MVSVHSGLSIGDDDAVGLARLAQELGVERRVVGNEVGVVRAGATSSRSTWSPGGADSTMCRRMPWMPTGPTRNHQRRRGATRLDQRSSTRPLPSTTTRPICST